MIIEQCAENSGMIQYVAANNKFLERFAHLIIAECIKAVTEHNVYDQLARDTWSDSERAVIQKYRDRALNSAALIAQHFGVNMLTDMPDMSSVEKIAENTLNGSAHFAAWSAVFNTIYEIDPAAFSDPTKTGVEQAVDWIKTHCSKSDV